MASDRLSPEASSWASARRASASRRTLIADDIPWIVSRYVIHHEGSGGEEDAVPLSGDVGLRRAGHGLVWRGEDARAVHGLPAVPGSEQRGDHRLDRDQVHELAV